MPNPAALRIAPALTPARPTDATATTSPADQAPVPILLDSRAAAKMLAISERTLWALTDAGEVPCVRIGRAKRYSLASLRKYVERLEQDTK
jgi:hypothetical protein